jgi:hypothetical protein
MDPAFIDVFFNFANTFTEESVLYSEVKRRKRNESAPNIDVFRDLGYTDEQIANMDIGE